MKDRFIGFGVAFVMLVGFCIIFLMFYGIYAGYHPTEPKHYHQGPQDPLDTQ